MKLKYIKNGIKVAKNNKYSIAYREIGVGNHIYEFDINKKFFLEFESSEISNGECKVIIKAEKANNSLDLYVNIKGDVEVTCDRCLDVFYIPIEFDGALTVKFSEDVESGEIDCGEIELGEALDSDIFWQNSTDPYIDLSHYIYESICLSLPYQRIHPQNDNGIIMCNEDMLSRFIIVDAEDN